VLGIAEGDDVRHAVFDGLPFRGVSLKECVFEDCSFEAATFATSA